MQNETQLIGATKISNAYIPGIWVFLSKLLQFTGVKLCTSIFFVYWTELLYYLNSKIN